MKTKIITVLMAFSLIFYAPVFAAENISVTLDGAVLEFDVLPQIINNRTMVPMRKIFEALGAVVAWDDTTQTAIGVKDSKTILLSVGSEKAYVNGNEFTIDAPAQIVNGRTFVPVRFISEALDIVVEWNEETKTVIIDTKAATPKVKEALEKLDSLIDERILEWNASLFDPEIGGFYAAVSARDNEGYLPDIQSTAQALGFLATAGFPLKKDMPRTVADKISGWAKSVQSPDDGYFYNPQWGNEVSEARRGRDLTFALKLIEQYGDGKPLYKTPEDRSKESQTKPDNEATTVISYLQSKEALVAWLNNLWETARNHYAAASTIQAVNTAIKGAGYTDEVIDFIYSKQDPDTGLWDDAMDYNTVGACYKFTDYFHEQYKLHYADKMINNMVNIFKEKEATAIVDPYNVINTILTCYQSFGDDVPPEVQKAIDDNLIELINITCEQYQRFRKADGGYSYSPDKGMEKSFGCPIALGIAEGDMDSPGKVLSSRNALYTLAGVTAEKPYTEEAYQKYMRTVENAPKVVKKKPVPFSLNFEDEAVGSVPLNLTVNASTENDSADIQKDTSSSKVKNQALEIKSTVNGSVSAYFNFPQLSGNIRAKYRIMVDSSSSGNFYFRFGVVGTNNMALYMMAARSGQTFDLRYRTIDSGGTQIAGKLECDTWYDITVEYEPAGISDTVVRYYVDDELKLTTKEYFNNGDITREPVKDISNYAFGTWLATKGSIYIDDFSVESYTKQTGDEKND